MLIILFLAHLTEAQWPEKLRKGSYNTDTTTIRKNPLASQIIKQETRGCSGGKHPPPPMLRLWVWVKRWERVKKSHKQEKKKKRNIRAIVSCEDIAVCWSYKSLLYAIIMLHHSFLHFASHSHSKSYINDVSIRWIISLVKYEKKRSHNNVNHKI